MVSILTRRLEVVIVAFMRLLYLVTMPHRPEEGSVREHLEFCWVSSGEFLRSQQSYTWCEVETYPRYFDRMMVPRGIVERLVRREPSVDERRVRLRYDHRVLGMSLASEPPFMHSHISLEALGQSLPNEARPACQGSWGRIAGHQKA